MLVNGTNCPQQRQFPVIVVGPEGEYLNWLAATSAINKVRGLEIWQGTGSEGDWMPSILSLPLPRIGVIVLMHAGDRGDDPESQVEALEPLRSRIRQDLPDIVLKIRFEDKKTNTEHDAALLKLQVFVQQTLDYTLNTLGADGTLSELPSGSYRDCFLYAQPNSNTRSNREE